MVDYPYILKPSSAEDFLKRMHERPEPRAVSQAYLDSLGYKSSNDRQIIPMLKFVNFLASNGAPDDNFRSFRDTSKQRAVMAQALVTSYEDLFKTIPKPCEASDEDLENFFRTATGKGGRMLKATVDAFKVLCKFADLAAITQPTPTPTPTSSPLPAPISTPAPIPVVQLPTREGGVILNVSVRLELPATQDAGVYDKIFESLKRHLLTPSSKTD